MAESKAELLLHPVRIRIIQTMVNGSRQTAQQIAAHLADVPPATLYRHINKLTAAGVLTIVEQRQVRGAVEKIYELAHSNLVVNQEDLSAASREDLMRHFITFAAVLLGDYSRYLAQPEVNLEKDGVGFRQVPLYLSDEEFQAMVMGMRDVVMKFAENQPAPGRRRRILSTVIMPDVEQK